MRFLLSFPLPLLLILISFVSFESLAEPLDAFNPQEPWPTIGRLNRRSAIDPSTVETGPSTQEILENFQVADPNPDGSPAQLKSDWEEGQKNLTKLNDLIAATSKTLNTTIEEGVPIKKDYEEKKKKFEELDSKLKRLTNDNAKAESAKTNFTNANGALSTAESDLASAQEELDKMRTAKARFDAASNEQTANTTLLRELETALPTLESDKNIKFNPVNDFDGRIKFLEDGLIGRDCNAPSKPCRVDQGTIDTLRAQRLPAFNAYTIALEKWTSTKAKITECKTNLVNLKAEIKDLKPDAMQSESELKDAVTKAEGEKNLAAEDLEKKKKIMEETPSVSPADLDATEVNKARGEYDKATFVKNENMTAEDKLTKRLKALEDHRNQMNERVGALKRKYEEELAKRDTGLGSTGKIAIGATIGLIVLCAMVAGIVWFVFKRKKTPKGGDKGGAATKDTMDARGGSSAVSKTPATPSETPTTSQKPAIDQSLSPQQPPLQASDSKEQAPVEQKDAPYLASCKPPVKAEYLPTNDDQQTKDKNTIIATSNKETMVYELYGTKVYDTENAEGNNKRILNNGCVGEVQDGRKYRHAFVNIRTGVLEEGERLLIDEDKANPTPGEPHFSAKYNVFLYTQNMDRPSKSERAFDKEAAKKSQKERANELETLWSAYRNQLKKTSQKTDAVPKPGFDLHNEHIVLKGNAKCPDIKRLTHDSQGIPRDMSVEKRKQLGTKIITSFEKGRRTGKFQFSKDDQLNLLNETMKLFKEENRCIELESHEIFVIGDVHGCLDVLMALSAALGGIGSKEWEKHTFVFTGDYVDRGKLSLAVIMFLFALKLRYPKQIILLRGNHESYEINIHYGFLQEMTGQFESVQEGTDMHFYFNYVFAWEPLACFAGGVMLGHGGIPTCKFDGTLQEAINRLPPFIWNPTTNDLAMGILWSDPESKLKGFTNNKRGAGSCFGEDIVHALTTLKLIIRAHQVVRNGSDFFAGKKMITLFTCTDYDPDKYRNHGGILRITKNFVCYFIELVPGKEIPANLNDSERKALKETMKSKAAEAHNRNNFLSTLKGVLPVEGVEEPSMTEDGAEPEGNQC